MYASDLRLLTDGKKYVGECVNIPSRATSPEREKIKHRSLDDGMRWEGVMSPAAHYRAISVYLGMPSQTLPQSFLWMVSSCSYLPLATTLYYPNNGDVSTDLASIKVS